MLLAFFSSLVATAAIILLLRKTRLQRIFHDSPTARGLHNNPVPRIGGIALFFALAISANTWLAHDSVGCIVGVGLLLFVVSVIDDVRPLPALLRLLVHTAAAILIVLFWINAFGLAATSSNFVGNRMLYPAATLAFVFAIVWMTNLYNFMDGADGLAGGMTVIGFGIYAVAFALHSSTMVSSGVLAAAVSGAAAGFLIFNFPPAKVFMGDAGSIPLGFLAITLGIHGSLLGLWPWWFAALVFSPFIVDATATLVRRTALGHKPWIAHRDHYYQRLILSGWSHRKTTLTYYCAMVASGGSALCLLHDPNAYFALFAWVITYGLLLLALERYLHQKKNNKIKE